MKSGSFDDIPFITFSQKCLLYALQTNVILILDDKAALQTIEANLVCSTLRVSGKLNISQVSVVHLHDLTKKHPEQPNCASCYQNFAKLLTCSSINKQKENKTTDHKISI